MIFGLPENIRDVGADPSKFTVSKGTVDALLAKVYATKSPANWDSVAYYCDQVIPQYSLVTKYSYLWDNNHKDNSEAIWELPFTVISAGDQVGNWAPSIWVGGSQGHTKAADGKNSTPRAMISSAPFCLKTIRSDSTIP